MSDSSLDAFRHNAWASRVKHPLYQGGPDWESKLGVVLTEAMYHATQHRTEVSMMITQLGKEPPDLSAWRYGEEKGLRGPALSGVWTDFANRV